ncbi:MAG: cobalamin-independent methionine synthase II family protein [Gammaproteobacteria bacterium]
MLTTHVGSLPRPPELVAAYRRGSPESAALEPLLRQSVSDVVRKQQQIGIDIVNDGEFGKPVQDAVDYGAWMNYVSARMSGFEVRVQQTGMFPGKDREDFNEFYKIQAIETGEIRPVEVICTGPITYTGHAALQRDIGNFRAALGGKGEGDAFVPLVSPTSLESLQPNEYYKTAEEYAWALAAAMKEEYEAVAKAGFIVQVDDPGIWVLWDFWFAQAKTFAEFRRFAEARVEMLNFALKNIPQEQIRYHVCWGSWHGPHSADAPLRDIVDLILRVKVGAYCVEAANVRHETDWKVWRDCGIPDDRILIPGVVSHSTNLLETPELIADRLVQYASIVGRENVIAGTDCGLGGRVHPQIAWAKLKALVDGAALATKQLWKAR